MNYNKQPESQRGQTPQAAGGGAVAAGLDEAGGGVPGDARADSLSRDAANFIGLVLGCIETKFCKQICV